MKGRCKRFLIFKNRKARKKNMKDQMVRVAKEFAADESGVGVVEMILILSLIWHVNILLKHVKKSLKCMMWMDSVLI